MAINEETILQQFEEPHQKALREQIREQIRDQLKQLRKQCQLEAEQFEAAERQR
jgi:colicin import membrane protein